MKNVLKDIHLNALLGFEIDKKLKRYYQRTQKYVIGSLADLNEVALKIRTNDIL